MLAQQQHCQLGTRGPSHSVNNSCSQKTMTIRVSVSLTKGPVRFSVYRQCLIDAKVALVVFLVTAAVKVLVSIPIVIYCYIYMHLLLICCLLTLLCAV